MIGDERQSDDPSPGIVFPKAGMEPESVLEQMAGWGAEDADYREARTFSLVYYLGEEHTEFLKRAYAQYFSENALNPMAFKSLKRLESEVVAMTASLLHGDGQTGGTMTSGGTESCMLAVKTCRDFARAKRPWVRRPELLMPDSAHVAFEKAAHYFGVKAVRVPVGSDLRANVRLMKKRMSRNTILMVASAPSYPHGVVDPVEELGQLAKRRGVPLHVDACLGGFLLPFVERLGHSVPAFDFRCPGVTSMSADVHKYGWAAKGASVVLYAQPEMLKHQFFVYENWPGGLFASPAMLGTRPGGAIAAAWAAIRLLGEEGYLEHARTIMETAQRFRDGISNIPSLQVMGKPHMGVFAYRSTDPELSIYAVADGLEARGWHVDRQHRPECIHLMITPWHKEVVDSYVADLRHSVDAARRDELLGLQGTAAMYGMISRIPLRRLVKKQVLEMMLELYGPGGKQPDLAAAAQGEDLLSRAGLAFLRLSARLRSALGRRNGESG